MRLGRRHFVLVFYCFCFLFYPYLSIALCHPCVELLDSGNHWHFRSGILISDTLFYQIVSPCRQKQFGSCNMWNHREWKIGWAVESRWKQWWNDDRMEKKTAHCEYWVEFDSQRSRQIPAWGMKTQYMYWLNGLQKHFSSKDVTNGLEKVCWCV